MATFTPTMPRQQVETPEEVTPDNPMLGGGESDDAAKQRAKEEEDEDAALKLIITTAKESWAPKRRVLVRRVLRAIEYLKSNPYGVMDPGTNSFSGPIGDVLTGSVGADDPKLYEYNDNFYQMLCLSFIAALSPDIPKVRWMPGNPQEEGDLSFAKKASTMMAFIERQNDMPSLQALELLYLWVAGTYFSYTRNMVDAVRGGTTKTPVMAMQSVQIMPNRYLCPGCGTPNPEDQMHPMGPKQCQDCGTGLNDSHWYPAENADIPTQVDEEEQPNSFTAINVFCLLNVDVDPFCESLAETSILDLEGEMSKAAVRARYPGRYKEITGGQYGADGDKNSDARIARESVAGPAGSSSSRGAAGTRQEQNGTYSRCWIQDWAFFDLEDEQMALRLKKKYPKGVKVVRWGDLVLEKRAEALNDKWTECRTIKGLGMNPFGVGDVALSVQDRVDETANNIHAYQDRLALPPVLAHANLINADALSKQAWGGGRVISVYPSAKMPGQRYNLQEALWQPQFHVDANIYSYSQTLMTLMQLLTGVQPQIFGGGTQKNVDTAQGQEQMLNTAMGRLMLFLQAMRSEHAIRAKLAVKAMAADIEDQKRITIEGDVEGEYENFFILQSDVQGEIHGYPMADQGFPASYGEMRDRLLQLLGMVAKNPVLENMLSDPDMQKLFALYLLPDGAKLPGDSERTKVKLILQQLGKAEPVMMAGQVMSSIQPDPDCDDMSEIVELAKDWMQRNYEMATTNPKGYANVRAYLKLAAQNDQLAQAKQSALQAAQGAPPQGQGAGGAQAA